MGPAFVSGFLLLSVWCLLAVNSAPVKEGKLNHVAIMESPTQYQNDRFQKLLDDIAEIESPTQYEEVQNVLVELSAAVNQDDRLQKLPNDIAGIESPTQYEEVQNG